MKRFALLLLGMTVALISLQEAQAQGNRNSGLPKVDYQVLSISRVGQGLAVSVRNGGFEMSPGTTIAVAIHNAQNRQLIGTRFLTVPAMQPGQTRRAIFVPPNNVASISVLARIDPGNRVPETNERNNYRVSKF